MSYMMILKVSYIHGNSIIKNLKQESNYIYHYRNLLGGI